MPGETRKLFRLTRQVNAAERIRARPSVTSFYLGVNMRTGIITRVAANTVNYEFTVEDPATWTKPWTARIPWSKIDPSEQMYEYACHEDNYDIVHFLTGARKREKNGETMPSRPVTGGVSQDR